MKKIVRVEASFGSKFQEEVSMQMLEALLSAWKVQVITQHKKNKVEVCTEHSS